MRNLDTFLVDIRPRVLNFIFEVKKQCSSSILLVNNTSEYVAFKVKTTSPKKYSVRPNGGIIMPKSTREFTVTMQPQKTAPPDMICKDKFLVQSTVVPLGTTDDNITSSMFDKGIGKYVEDVKMRVTLVSPLRSPVLSPLNLPIEQEAKYETVVLKDHHKTVETSVPHQKVAKDVEELKEVNVAYLKPTKEEELMTTNVVDLKPQKEPETNATRDEKLTTMTTIQELKPINELSVEKDGGMKAKIVEEYQEKKLTTLNTQINEVKPTKDAGVESAAAELLATRDLNPVQNVDPKPKENVEHLRLGREIEKMKSKLNQLESKLSEAEVTILKLAEERRITIQERDKIKAQVTMLQTKGGVRTVHVGFPLLFVCMVAFISVMLGYVLQP